jgi:outer membrane murein-binding lipoprotein Lpp
MPIEVRDWIEQASSRLQRLSSEVDRLKVENAELKAYRKFAEKRILRSEHED